MKTQTAIIIAIAILSQGCAIVKTYDSNGNILGECDSYGFGWHTGCTGSANPHDQGHSDPIGPKQEACPKGSTPNQIGECYPINPIFGGEKK